MERESFESEDTAKILNENFVSIKVDREERPDVDKVYMVRENIGISTVLTCFRHMSRRLLGMADGL